MSNVTVNLDVGIWLNSKGQVELFVGEDPKPVEMLPLLDLVKMEVNSHKVRFEDPLDWDDVKKITRLKKALLNCTAYLTKEMLNAK